MICSKQFIATSKVTLISVTKLKLTETRYAMQYASVFTIPSIYAHVRSIYTRYMPCVLHASGVYTQVKSIYTLDTCHVCMCLMHMLMWHGCKSKSQNVMEVYTQ